MYPLRRRSDIRFLAPLVSLFSSFLFSHAQTGSTVIPPDESRTLGMKVPDVTLVDSTGREFSLYELKGKPLLISPVYTHCASACPIIMRSLKKTVRVHGQPGKDFNILSLTFDPRDAPEDISNFREKHKLPEGWKVVLVKDKSELFKLLDAIDFRFATLPGRDFVHPNLIVFLDKDMVIRDYMYGVTFDSAEFANLLRIARRKTALPENFRGYIPLVSMLGFVGTLTFLIVRFSRSAHRRKEVA